MFDFLNNTDKKNQKLFLKYCEAIRQKENILKLDDNLYLAVLLALIDELKEIYKDDKKIIKMIEKIIKNNELPFDANKVMKKYNYSVQNKKQYDIMQKQFDDNRFKYNEVSILQLYKQILREKNGK